MVGAMRVVSVERGFDPRDFVLLPFGGAGPLHGCALARLVGCRTILVPPAPGVLSALGLLVSNLRAEFSRTCVQRAGRYDTQELAAVFGELAAAAGAWLDQEEVPAGSRRLQWIASLRYKDQGFELDVPWAGATADEATVAGTVEAFHAMHERLYSFAQRDMPVEIVTLRVDAIGLVSAVSMPTLGKGGDVATAVAGRQRIAFQDGAREVPIFDRARLGAGARVDGPAVFAQLDATTLVLPGQTAEVHPSGSLIVQDN
jgi:N-methylhydantoinase A